jgi:hypothetical protein
MSFGKILGYAATGFQMFGQLQQAKAQQRVFEYNAAVNRQRAEMIQQAGALQVQRMRREKRKFASKQIAAYAKAGVRMTGSPLQVIADTATELEMDILIEDYNTRIGVINAQAGAELDVMRGNIARQAGYWSAGSTLLTQLPNFVSSLNKAKVPVSTASSYVVPTAAEEKAQMSLLPQYR